MFRFNCEVKDLCVQKNMRDLKNACSFRYNIEFCDLVFVLEGEVEFSSSDFLRQRFKQDEFFPASCDRYIWNRCG